MVPPAGLEPAACGLGNRRRDGVTADSASSCAKDEKHLASCLAFLLERIPDLGPVVKAWPDLPDAVKAGILAMVKATGAR